ncbi:hypothetical protein PIB30_073139 [Stylosanthes scabra]|uniref:Uncharacterized protein n=1 Tax=Stylosanthes scabra TaxID=79078 RepID=A0ABU6ZMW6_9FABA|nr:hypothetical protein [Stylosanthes scabra]
MAEERASNSSTSTDDSTATDKTQPSPSRAASMPLTSPVSTPLQGNASSWVPPQQFASQQTTSGWVPTPTNVWVPPSVASQDVWPEFGLPLNYTPPIEPASRGQGGFMIRNNPVYSNPTPSTQLIPLGWYPPPSQGGNYGYSNNPQPSFGAYGIGGTPLNFGTYNPQIMYSSLQSSSSNPTSTPVPQPAQAATSLPQVVSTRNNRTIFPEMSRQMPTSSNPVNNMLTPMIENNNAKIDQVAQQVNELAENFNPQPPRHQMYNHRNPPAILARGVAGNRAQGVNAAQAYGNNITQAVEQILNRAGFNLGVTNQPYFISPFPNFVQQDELPRGIKVPKSLTKFLGERANRQLST